MAVGTLLFSVCWFLANGVSGDFWYLAWLAPIPILLATFYVPAKTTFVIALVACLLGRLSYFFYLVHVATISVAIVVTLLLSLVFAFIVLLTRRTVVKTNAWYSIFAFPALFTAFEYMMTKLSADGTSSSIAYSQSDFLPVVQIASVAGISGITFFLTFIPSSIAVGLYYRKQRNKLRCIIVVTIAISIAVIGFSAARLSRSSEKNTIKAGLIVLDENLHNTSRHPDFEKEKVITAAYSSRIAKLADRGAQLIVLPEKAINIKKETAPGIMEKLCNAARQNHVFIIAGYVNYRNLQEYNSALVINTEGKILADYNKVYLVKGWEDRFAKGNSVGLYSFLNTNVGIAICKDLDFPDYMRNYGKLGIAFITIPAWDFVVDDWLHSRMAIIRGVENGFSEIRTAREGRLTISDSYGRITAEAISSADKEADLVGNVSLQKENTFYDEFGDWLGIVSLLLSGWFLFSTIKIKRRHLT